MALNELSNETINEAVSVLVGYREGQLSQQQTFTALDQLGIGPDDMEAVLDLAIRVVKSRERDKQRKLDNVEGTVIVCGICQQQLNRFPDADGELIWTHPRVWEEYGHEPQPTEIPSSQFHGSACDFCGRIMPIRFEFHGENVHMAVLGDPNGRMDNLGDVWSACADCGPDVQTCNVNALYARLVKGEGTQYAYRAYEQEQPEMAAEFKRQHRQNTIEMWRAYFGTIRSVKEFREPAKLVPRMMPKLQQGLIKFWNHPNLHTMLCKSGLNHHLPGVHAGDEERFAVDYVWPQVVPENVWTNHVQHLTAGLRTSELYWITSTFTQLATMAGKDFTKLVISREELPAPFGFMIYEQPIGVIKRPDGDAGIRGVSWTLVPQGIWICLYIQGEDNDSEVDIEQMRAELGWLLCTNVGVGIAFNKDIPDDAITPELQFLRTIFATWALMVQPGVAEHTTAPVDKKYARSYQRQYSRKLPDVKLVDLRRQPTRKSESETREGRQLGWRVYRKGHWKRQFYGTGRALRKTIYVSGYIAGPEDAPLYQRPTTVKVVR